MMKAKLVFSQPLRSPFIFAACNPEVDYSSVLLWLTINAFTDVEQVMLDWLSDGIS